MVNDKRICRQLFPFNPLVEPHRKGLDGVLGVDEDQVGRMREVPQDVGSDFVDLIVRLDSRPTKGGRQLRDISGVTGRASLQLRCTDALGNPESLGRPEPRLNKPLIFTEGPPEIGSDAELDLCARNSGRK